MLGCLLSCWPDEGTAQPAFKVLICGFSHLMWLTLPRREVLVLVPSVWILAPACVVKIVRPGTVVECLLLRQLGIQGMIPEGSK